MIETRFPSILPIDDGPFTSVAASMALSFGLTSTRTPSLLSSLSRPHLRVRLQSLRAMRGGPKRRSSLRSQASSARRGRATRQSGLRVPARSLSLRERTRLRLGKSRPWTARPRRCRHDLQAASGRENRGDFWKMDTDATVRYRDLYAGFNSTMVEKGPISVVVTVGKRGIVRYWEVLGRQRQSEEREDVWRYCRGCPAVILRRTRG